MHQYMNHVILPYWTHQSPVPTVGDMVTCVIDPETRQRHGSAGFRRINVALFCAGQAFASTVARKQ
jgi:hypothetical protein